MGRPSLSLPLTQVLFTVLDVETTGLDVSLGHRLCEIALVRGRVGQEPEEFSQYVNPERPVDPGARAVHGIPDTVLWRSPRFAEIAPSVRDLVEGTVIVAHNAPFDLGFLAAEWRRLRWPAPAVHIVDTLSLARRWLRLPNNRLGSVARALRVSVRGAHSALGDARMTWGVLQALIRYLQGYGFTTLGDLINAQGGPVVWPGTMWQNLPDPLREALQTGRRLWLRYLGQRRDLTERWVEPLDVNGGYLIAYCHLRGEQRTFRLDRILEMRLEDRNA
ncbi:MAG: WYL domain-containing protein [Chloroflexi bacterium]|nr:WYL domain-containing protein [Chloroflexota bacterium]